MIYISTQNDRDSQAEIFKKRMIIMPLEFFALR